MSSAAPSRSLSRTAAGAGPVVAGGILIWRRIRRLLKIGKDRRTLQTLPESVLADLGLERLEVRSSTGSRDVWIIPHRYY